MPKILVFLSDGSFINADHITSVCPYEKGVLIGTTEIVGDDYYNINHGSLPIAVGRNFYDEKLTVSDVARMMSGQAAAERGEEK